jgi:hypothetical protein
MRYGIQRNLPAKSRGVVTAHLRDEGVRRFVTRRREQERHIPDESENEKIRAEIGQVFLSLSPAWLKQTRGCHPALQAGRQDSYSRALWFARACSRYLLSADIRIILS